MVNHEKKWGALIRRGALIMQNTVINNVMKKKTLRANLPFNQIEVLFLDTDCHH